MSRSVVSKEPFSFLEKPKTWNFQDLSGREFGRLTVDGFVGKRGKHVMWGCTCACGSRVVIYATNLTKGNTGSCGCLHSEAVISSKTKHGHCKSNGPSTEYVIHRSMVARCLRPQQNNKHFHRGITVCDRWVYGESGLSGFECFLADMGPRPDRMSLDRINNDGNYEPGNCRWATRVQQARNTSRNVWVVVGGTEMIMTDALKHFGISKQLVSYRMRRGWSRIDALMTPANGDRQHD